MHKYFIYFKNYTKALWLAPALVLIDVFCEIVQPSLMSHIVDRGIAQKNLHYILQTGGIMVALSIVAIAANIGNIYYSSHASVGFAAALRKGIFNKVQEFSFSNLDKFSSASLVTRITNDVNILQEVVMMSLRMLIRGPLMLLFAVGIAISINAPLAVIIAVAIPVLTVCIFFILRKALPYFEQMQKRLDNVNRIIQENLVNIRVVKSLVREEFEIKKFAVSNGSLREMAVKASGLVVLILPVMQLVMNISIVSIVWFGGNKIINGNFQVGQLMSFITYNTQILMSLTMLAMTIMTFSRAQASSERILEVLNTRIDITDGLNAAKNNYAIKKGKVVFEAVYFKYHAQAAEYVLKNINLTAESGQTVAIIGATGSSKSTLVELIPRLYDVSKGRILVNDIDIREYRLLVLRGSINMVLQQNELFSGTIKQNIKWGKAEASDAEVVAAAKDAQADDFIQSFEKAYETILGQGGVNLSGGQKQRICLARAILGKPAILILDDSTSAVDTSTDAKIRASFKQHLPDTTTFIIAQRIRSVQSADKIIILDEGSVIASGNHGELMKASPVYQEIFNSQQLNEAGIS
jgi:ATP-binding cassette subfamily B multidrug efflux pump